MKKTIYSILAVVTFGLMLYTSYYMYGHKPIAHPLLSIATSTPQTASSTQDTATTKVFTTTSNKTLTIKETNPDGASLSTIVITPNGFATNTPITLEENKLTDTFLIDMNKDGSEELVLVTTAQGSGSFGEAIIYTTVSSSELLPVAVPSIAEEDTNVGGLFEGYMGHDSFEIINGMLVREFPTYNASDTNSEPTGPRRSVLYSLSEKNGAYSIQFLKYTPSNASSTQLVPITASSSKAVATTTPKTATTTNATSSITTTLPGTSWVWTSTTATGTTQAAPKGDKFVLSFDGKGATMHSTTDCNTLNGEYVVSKDTIRFGDFMSTMMFCEGSQESSYAALLAKTRFFKIKNNELDLIISDKNFMTFTLKTQ